MRPSKYGVGVFAVREIPKKINPFSNCRKVRWLKFKEKEISKLSGEVVKMIKDFYGSDNGFYYIPSHGLDGNDVSFYINHSSKPNVFTKDDGLTFFTTRKIKKGEELFADYNTYDPLDEILSK